MSATHITYRIKLSEENVEEFDYKLEEETFNLIADESIDLPDWTRLEFKQCSHCPLDPEQVTHCPVATQLHDIIERFHETTSVDEVEVEVISEERKVSKTTDLQSAISSMFGLVFPSCGCPKTAYMKPMARFHLPLVTEEESIFHVTGMYLLSQYFKNKGNISDPFAGLAEVYTDLHVLNKAVKERFVQVTHSDSVKNAITLIDMYSTLIPMLIEDELVELRGFFNAYFTESEKEEQKKEVTDSPGYLAKAKAFKLELMPISGEEDSGEKKNPFMVEEEEEKETVEAEPENKEEEIDIESKFNISGLSLEPIDEDQEEKEEEEKKEGAPGRASFSIDED